MKNLNAIIEKRNLPELMKGKCGKAIDTSEDFLLRREEIKKILSNSEYGIIPEKPKHLKAEIISCDEAFAGGKVSLSEIRLTLTFEEKEFSFLVSSAIPKTKDKCPAILHISFFDAKPNKYEPTEEICDKGFAIFSFKYDDITTFDGNFKSGISPYFSKSRRCISGTGKIAMWAWAAMRVMDYVESLDEIDKENVAVIGHSLLGKAALVVGAFDERFKFTISNNSGTSGAALSRAKRGESAEKLTNEAPFLFCKKYSNSMAKFYDTKEFDQHFLLALIAPRFLAVGSAESDFASDAESEFLSCFAASEAYSVFGLQGLVSHDEIPTAKVVLSDGEISYHLREGLPYLSLEDWRIYIDFIKKNLH